MMPFLHREWERAEIDRIVRGATEVAKDNISITNLSLVSSQSTRLGTGSPANSLDGWIASRFTPMSCK